MYTAKEKYDRDLHTPGTDYDCHGSDIIVSPSTNPVKCIVCVMPCYNPHVHIDAFIFSGQGAFGCELTLTETNLIFFNGNPYPIASTAPYFSVVISANQV